MNDDKPFLCPVKDCGMQFTNEDHLNVHTKKHEMSLALNTGKNSSSACSNFLDQTPTPTNFLKNCCEEINLFQELSKNPFDDAYKKALDPDISPLPGPQTNELNTPTLVLNDNAKYNSVASVVSTSLLRNAGPVVPSPLAKKHNATSSRKDFNGRAGGTSTKNDSEDLTMTSSSQQLYLSGKSITVLQQHLVSKRAKSKDICDLTSQVADSTSTEFPILSSPSSQVKAEPEISSSSVTTIPQPLSSPHSTTSSNFTLLQPNSLIQKDDIVSTLSDVKKEPDDLAMAASSSQQQCTMQVWLQLPSGQTVPISIPATINNMQVLETDDDVLGQIQSNQGAAQPSTMQSVNSHLPQCPVLQPAPTKGRTPPTTHPGQNTTNALKQRLKAQLQNQLSPTAKSLDSNLVSPSNSAFIPAAVSMPVTATTPTQVFITNPSDTSPIMMMDSPGSEVNLSDSSDYSIDNKRQKMSPDSEDPKERRRKFLERNRAAAARCRQKRKHWIGNLERKADELVNTNVRLQSDVKLLRGEVAHLKTLLLAHKDCPVTQQQRSSGQLQHLILGESSTFSNQELAQVVPTAEVGAQSIHLNHPTIVTFVQESLTGQQFSDMTKQD